MNWTSALAAWPLPLDADAGADAGVGVGGTSLMDVICVRRLRTFSASSVEALRRCSVAGGVAGGEGDGGGVGDGVGDGVGEGEGDAGSALRYLDNLWFR